MSFYMGIDLGTSSVRALLMDLEGNVIGIAQRGYDIGKRKLSWAEQNMQELWDMTCEAIREIGQKYPKQMDALEGISYSGQMHGLVMIDEKGELIRDAIIWADQRSGEQIQKVYDTLGKDYYRSIVGNSLSTGFLLASLLWIRDNEPQIYSRIAHVMLPKDYIRFRMCGQIGTEMSDASSSAIFHTAERRWAWELIDALELPREIFPDCHESCEIAGTVQESCAQVTGLKTGVSIAYGGGDTLMMAVGNGIITPGTLASNIGTACQLSAGIESPIFDPQYRTNTFCHVKENLWLLMGAHLSGGVALKWLMRQMLKMKSYDEMTALAATAPPGSDGMVFLPYLSGERTPYNDPKAKGIYFGMTLAHNKAHMIRSTMEGIIFGLRSSMDIFDDLGIERKRIIASGGGARSQLFLQMQADLFDCEIWTNTGQEQAGIGAALTAAVACGAYSGYQEACEAIVRLSEVKTEPCRENQSRYQESYGIFRELYSHNQDLFHR